MIQRLSKIITNEIFIYGHNKDSYSIHKYGIEVIISTCLNFLLILLIGHIMNVIMDSIIYFVSFYFLRKFTGGYHCKTYFNCITFHCLIFILFSLNQSIWIQYSNVILATTLITIIAFCPINIRKLSNVSIRQYKYISLIIVFTYYILCKNTNLGIFSFINCSVSLLIYLYLCTNKNEKNVT